MMQRTRRTLLKRMLRTVWAGSLIALAGWRVAQATDAPRIINVSACRFSFTSSEIIVKAGERIVPEVKSIDLPHGMNFQYFKIRGDLATDRISRIELPAQRLGIDAFVCDNPCGNGHEEMHGELVVAG